MIIINTSIRGYIINNFKNDKKDVLRKAIEGSIKEQDEETLPGMGVFLEIIWSDSSEEQKEEMLDIIMNRLKNEKQNFGALLRLSKVIRQYMSFFEEPLFSSNS